MESVKPIIITVYSTYTPAHQRACKKYYEKNKEKMLSQQRERDEKQSEAKKVFRQFGKLLDALTV